MQFEFVKTYIDKIDKELGGGIVKKSSVLFLGSKNSKKEIILMKILENRLKNGDAVLYITTNNKPDMINMIFANNNINIDEYEQKNMFNWIDAYSKSVGETVTDTERVVNVSNPQALNEINISINKSNENLWNITPELINVYDNISVSLVQKDPVLTKRFFHHLIGNIKKNNATLFLIMDKDAQDKETVALMSLFCDYVFEFEKYNENKKDEIKLTVNDIYTNTQKEIII
ncbi:MAG: hypothetical protein KAR87_05550 [Candidatus Aenigmarchaeota archaeon]|nr:hypothetical protein [Candidatus Aenigmarchaeota archaeon]